MVATESDNDCTVVTPVSSVTAECPMSAMMSIQNSSDPPTLNVQLLGSRPAPAACCKLKPLIVTKPSSLSPLLPPPTPFKLSKPLGGFKKTPKFGCKRTIDEAKYVNFSSGYDRGRKELFVIPCFYQGSVQSSLSPHSSLHSSELATCLILTPTSPLSLFPVLSCLCLLMHFLSDIRVASYNSQLLHNYHPKNWMRRLRLLAVTTLHSFLRGMFHSSEWPPAL